jgi:cation:H+ antiporter
MTLLFLLAGLVLLYFGAEGLVRGSSSIALRLGVGPLLIGLTVVAFGTSAPELVVSLKAALMGQGDISVGNVVGSNICNIGLILAFSALIVPIKVASQIVRVDTPIMIAVTGLALVLLYDGMLSRLEGIFLFSLLVVYIIFSILLAKKKPADALSAEFSEEIKMSKKGLVLDLAMVIGGLVMLVFGARFLVDSAIEIARSIGLSEAVIGLTIVAIGTSLPEFATSLVAALKKEADIAVGNVVGSNIFNILGILGITAVVTPLSSSGITGIDLGVMATFALALWCFSITGHRISRAEGILMIVAYAGYVAWLVARV